MLLPNSPIRKIHQCPKCGDVEESDTQPYCKTCSHIDRIDRKMDKLENK